MATCAVELPLSGGTVKAKFESYPQGYCCVANGNYDYNPRAMTARVTLSVLAERF